MEFKLWPLDIGGRVGVCDFGGMGNSFTLGVFCGELRGKRGGNHFTPKIVFLR